MTPAFAPPFIAADDCVRQLQRHGFAVLDPAAVCALTGLDISQFDALLPAWEGLPPDEYLKDGGRYRRRRHACFVQQGGTLASAPHRAHWQPVEYNALHGGMQRWFEPVAEAVVQTAGWQGLLRGIGAVCSALKGERAWFVEAHQFRIDTSDGIGRPTPEGAHRDGVDLVAVLLAARHGMKGGETRVFDAHGPDGQRFTLTDPWTLLLLDDARVIHETTPIQPLQPGTATGWRDTLVLTWRAGGFQGD